MKRLLDVLQEKPLLTVGPGISNLTMVDAIHPFTPKRPLLLEIVARQIGTKFNKDALCHYVLGAEENFCHRYQQTVWELFGDEDLGKVQHFAAYLFLLRKFIDRAAPNPLLLRRYESLFISLLPGFAFIGRLRINK